jgi:hypothetical protein
LVNFIEFGVNLDLNYCIVTILRSTAPSVSYYKSLTFFLSQTSLGLTKFIKKITSSTTSNYSFIRCNIKYILIMRVFCVINAVIFFINLIKLEEND